MADRFIRRRFLSGSRSQVAFALVIALAAAAAGSRMRAQENAFHQNGEQGQDSQGSHRDRHDWPMIGHDPANTRDQPFEHRIGPTNVHRLATKWVATMAGDVSATPAV